MGRPSFHVAPAGLATDFEVKDLNPEDWLRGRSDVRQVRGISGSLLHAHVSGRVPPILGRLGESDAAIGFGRCWRLDESTGVRPRAPSSWALFDEGLSDPSSTGVGARFVVAQSQLLGPARSRIGAM